MAKDRRLENKCAQLLNDFIVYAKSPWRLMWINFVAGVFRGLGALAGAAIVISAVIYLLSLFIMMPVFGKYAGIVMEKITEYIDDTNYNDELARLENELKQVNKRLSEIKSSPQE